MKHPNNRSRPISVQYIDAAVRLGCLEVCSRFNQSVLITEFPKSGGTWLTEMLSDLSGLPFPQNRIPPISSALFHGHYLRQFHTLPTIVLWRDPRDVVVSWYYHCLTSTTTNSKFQTKTNALLKFKDVNNIKQNLPMFIDHMFTTQTTPGFTWSEFFDFWTRKQSCTIHTSYELLSSDTEAELSRVTSKLGLDLEASKIKAVASAHSFENKSGRRTGDHDSKSFLRKGIVGDWSSAFSEEALDTLQKYIGYRQEEYNALVQLKFEPPTLTEV